MQIELIQKKNMMPGRYAAFYIEPFKNGAKYIV